MIETNCKYPDCSNTSITKGYCAKHYQRKLRYGGFDGYKPNHHLRYKPEYKSWVGAKSRCNNPKDNNYKNYGGRGIKMCERWLNSFENFYQDMGEKPFPDAQIDRIDNNGNYEPSNCKWVSSKENNRHTRNTKLDSEKASIIRTLYKAGEYTQQELADKFGVYRTTIGFLVRNKTWV